MATPADQRLLELLDKWLKSLELHARYSSLDDDSYWKVQPWIEHQRPSRWIIDLAKQKTIALQSMVRARMEAGDAKFSDSLELMIFLANLVGSEHIERFIPVAQSESEQPLQLARTESPPIETPAPSAAPAAAAVVATAAEPAAPKVPAAPAASAETAAATATREMPAFLAAKARASAPTGNAQVARGERKTAPAETAKSAQKSPARAPAVKATAKAASKPASAAAAPSETARDQVIADAARLVQWGRKWYELAELIARMADRPPLAEVRRILKDNKKAIDEKASNT
jgi:hypothetical protein